MMRKYKLFAFFLLVLAFLPLPAYAFDAWPNGTYWTGITTPSHYGAFVRADDIYGAAVYGLNKDPAAISVEDRLKLSDPDYGGRFYVYAQTFFNVDGWTNMPEWLPAYVMSTTVGLGQTFERVYASEVSTTLRDEALRDLELVLAGEDLGGGDSGGGADVSVSFPSSVTLDSPYGVLVTTRNWSTNVVPVSGTQSIFFSNTSGLSAYFRRIGCNYFYAFNAQQEIRNSGRVYSPQVLFYASATPVEFAFSSASGSEPYVTVSASSESDIYFCTYDGHGTNTFKTSNSGVMSGSFTYSRSDFSFSNKGHSYVWVGRGGSGNSRWRTTYLNWNGAPVVVPPAGDWPEPETPVTPTAPEQPTPTAPTVTPDNDPTEPVVTWPTSPTVVLPTQPTPSTTPSGLDYTGLLTLINDNLISIDDYVQAFNSSFNSFRSDFVTAVDSIVDSIRNIYNYLGHLNDILEVHCNHICDQIEDSVYNLELYIKDLFEWLPRQLDFDAEFNYDDSYVTMLLQRILNKIPGGSAGTPVTYQPNPQSDEPGFFDWLLDLWHRFLIDLVSVLPDELGGLVDAFSQLTHYFPFSIPWDLAALLALFEHEPVTPVFDVPWGFGGEEGEIQMVRVDLHVWDDVMEMVRPVFVAGFCIQLALITKELLENFDIHRGGV